MLPPPVFTNRMRFLFLSLSDTTIDDLTKKKFRFGLIQPQNVLLVYPHVVEQTVDKYLKKVFKQWKKVKLLHFVDLRR